MIVLDANIVVSYVLGRGTSIALHDALRRGLRLVVPLAQVSEAYRALVDKLGIPSLEADGFVEAMTRMVEVLGPETYRGEEARARERLHSRAQPDWPVLAAALAYEGGIWSHDRDFFGVGVPVWSTRNIAFAEPAPASSA